MLFTEAHQYKGEAKRIISLVPSITELLFSLDLNHEVIGITKFCIHPNEWYRNKIRIGGTKNIDIQKIESLNPDLIIANKEENVKEQISLLEIKYEVLLTDVNTFYDSLKMIQTIGKICNRNLKAEKIAATIEQDFANLSIPDTLLNVGYFIWKDPLMTVGGDTFISDMLQKAGFNNVFADLQRYPEVSFDEIRSRKPDCLFLSSEPYPFKQKHIDWLQKEIPGVKILLVDGEMFSWYGSRLLYAPAYFQKLRAAIEK